ncbi:hypothetical protein TNCT_320551 [Trichonephila clavata]|uniref:Uncharacterized protein n=1 Tax=Trichonephila clavata TaxID=2740835 RepID=A0A8X6K8M4_TRICU|nr:hypothetical protein TNCT_320551 [Trichonephila clavata]
MFQMMYLRDRSGIPSGKWGRDSSWSTNSDDCGQILTRLGIIFPQRPANPMEWRSALLSKPFHKILCGFCRA